MMNLILNGVAILKMALIKQFLWEPLIQKTHDPMTAQNNLLLGILKQNRETSFGLEHGFANITSYEEYRKAVSINSYETLHSYIEKQEEDKQPHLNSENPLMYARTSGSTGKPKFIPILKRTVAQYRKSQHIVAYAKYANIPGVYEGKVLAIVSPAVEGRMETGTPYGSMSGLIYQSMPTFVREKYVVPPNVFDIKDYEQKYYLITKYALAEKNISMIATANSSTLVKLKRIMGEQPKQLINDIRINNPKRADELQQLLLDKNTLVFSDIWPNLKSVTTWTGGSCAAQVSSVRKNLNTTTRIVEMGYLSSEFRGGITIDVLNNREIPAIHENFFEFVEKDDYENEMPEYITLDQVEEGKQYYIYATTQNGLYRYDINDLIEVTGWFNNTPTIRFIQKGKGITNLTGEKLYEAQLVQAMTKVSEVHSVDFNYFMMLGCPETLRYTLYIENEPLDMFEIEHHLYSLNMEYESKRKSGRLQPVEIVFLEDGTGEAYKQHILKAGQREGQFKLEHLQYKQDCLFDFSIYVRK